MKTFQQFIEQNISDILSSDPGTKDLKAEIRFYLQKELSGRDLDTAVNLFSYIYYKEGKGNIDRDWQEFKDYLKNNISSNRSLFVNHITRKQLEDLNDRYHIGLKISNKNFRKGPEGAELVDVPTELEKISSIISLPRNFSPSLWSGWKWVSLGCGYSGEEAAAGGHCGNEGAAAGDNIFSLRNPNSQVVLTFIVNVKTGAIGEAKALNNEKPIIDLHPPIIALLFSPYVKSIEGGGYAAEKNFSLEDLKYNEEIYNYFLHHLKGDKKHSLPNNYLPISWLDNITDDEIERSDKKAEILKNVLNIFSNYAVFDERNSAEQTSEPITKNFSIKFNFKSLVEQVLESEGAQKTKYLLDVYKQIVNVYSLNRVWGENGLKMFRPDLDISKIQKDEDGSFVDHIKKIPSVNIEIDTIKKVLDKLIEKNLSLRDKCKIKETTDKAKNSTDAEDGSLNIISNKILNEILEECLKLKKVPEYAGWEITGSFWRTVHDDSITYLGSIDFNPKKQTIEFTSYKGILVFENNEVVKEKVNESIIKLRHIFTKNGIPNGAFAEKYIGMCVDESLQDSHFSIVERSMLTNKFFKVQKRDYEGKTYTSHYKKVMDVKSVVENILQGNARKIIDGINGEIEEIKERALIKIIKNIEKIIIKNIDPICSCAKEKIKKYARLAPPVVKKGRKGRKVRWENPEQLSRERRATRAYVRQEDLKKAEREFNRIRMERIRKAAEEMQQRPQLESFKNWLVWEEL